MEKTYPSISLCMIAKNEEAMIGQAIRSVLPIVDQVVLVDTGSTDQTVSIAQELGAEVFHLAWQDDFSAPRNLSLQKATGDWILVLDADEAFAERDLTALRELTLDNRCCYKFNQRHYTNDYRLSNYSPCRGEYPEWEREYAGYFESALCRLFPNGCGIEYRGRVHELVEHSVWEFGLHQLITAEIRIHHYGHVDKERKSKQKSPLYTSLGEGKIKEDPVHWQNFFELAVEHNNSNRKRASVEYFRRAIELNPGFVPAWVNLGYVLCELGDFSDAEKVLRRALEIHPRAEEAWCNLGVVYLRAQHYADAEGCFRRAAQLKPDYVNAWLNLAQALILQERRPEAVLVYRNVLDLLPKCVPAKVALGSLYYDAGEVELAEQYLREAIHLDGGCANAYYQLGQLWKTQDRLREAREALVEFCNIVRQQQQLDDSTARLFAHAKADCDELKLQIRP